MILYVPLDSPLGTHFYHESVCKALYRVELEFAQHTFDLSN
jgi:hypothetical protein